MIEDGGHQGVCQRILPMRRKGRCAGAAGARLGRRKSKACFLMQHSDSGRRLIDARSGGPVRERQRCSVHQNETRRRARLVRNEQHLSISARRSLIVCICCGVARPTRPARVDRRACTAVGTAAAREGLLARRYTVGSAHRWTAPQVTASTTHLASAAWSRAPEVQHLFRRCLLLGTALSCWRYSGLEGDGAPPLVHRGRASHSPGTEIVRRGAPMQQLVRQPAGGAVRCHSTPLCRCS